MTTKPIKADLKSIESRAIRYLRNCWHDGQYITERATDFWSVCGPGEDCCLGGERKVIGSEVKCWPIRFTGKALLVNLTDTKGQQWFSWIHP